jgi:hypothetical protein
MGEPPITRKFVLLTAAVCIAVNLALVAVFMVWRDRQPDASGLADSVLSSMNRSFDDESAYRQVGLHASKITIIHAVGNIFEGQATVQSNSGGEHSINVHITYDGESMFWQTDSGAFAFTLGQ